MCETVSLVATYKSLFTKVRKNPHEIGLLPTFLPWGGIGNFFSLHSKLLLCLVLEPFSVYLRTPKISFKKAVSIVSSESQVTTCASDPRNKTELSLDLVTNICTIPIIKIRPISLIIQQNEPFYFWNKTVDFFKKFIQYSFTLTWRSQFPDVISSNIYI